MLKTYEAMFIFSNTIKDDILEKAVERIYDEISKLEGVVENYNLLGKQPFARSLKKMDSGIYAKLKFKMLPENIKSLLARFKLNEYIFRVQIIKINATGKEKNIDKPIQEVNNDG